MTKYEQYAIIESKISALEAEKEALRPEILKEMISENLEKVETAVGKFSVTKRKVYQYPEYVLEIGEVFKAAKAKAESTEEATYEEVESLRFTPAKL